MVVAHVVVVVVVVVIVVVVVVVVIVVVVVVFVVVVIVVFILVIVVVVVVSKIAGQYSYMAAELLDSRSVVFSHIMARDECPSKIHHSTCRSWANQLTGTHELQVLEVGHIRKITPN